MDLINQGWIEEVFKKSEDRAGDLQPWNDYYKLRAKEMERLLSMYKLEKVERILEIGCGNGFISAILSKSADEVITTDLSKCDVKAHSIGISRARELFKRLNIENCIPVSCSGERLPFGDETFDMVFCVYTLEHIPDRIRAMKEVRRVLKNNGEAIFIVPTFMERLLYPFSYYSDILKKAIRIVLAKNDSKAVSKYAGNAGLSSDLKITAHSNSICGKFRNSYPYFPMPDPHGEYPSYLNELVKASSFTWYRIMKESDFRIKKAFTIMLFPKSFSSIFLGGRSLEYYIKTLWIDKRFGSNPILKHLGQNLCLVLEKRNDQGLN